MVVCCRQEPVDSGAGVHGLTLDHEQLGQQSHLPPCRQYAVRKLLPRADRCDRQLRAGGWRRLYRTHVRAAKRPPPAAHRQVPPSSCTDATRKAAHLPQPTAVTTDNDGRETPCARVQPAGRANQTDAGLLCWQTAAAGADSSGRCCWSKRSEPALRCRRGTRAEPNGKAPVPSAPRSRIVQGYVRPTDYTCKRRGDRRRRGRLRRPLCSVRELLSLLFTGTVFVICYKNMLRAHISFLVVCFP